MLTIVKPVFNKAFSLKIPLKALIERFCQPYRNLFCPIRGLYSRLVISDRCKVRNYPNRVLHKSCRPPAGAAGQWAELGRKLRQTFLLTPRFAKVIWLNEPGSLVPLFPSAPISGLKTPVPSNSFCPRVKVGFTPPLSPPLCAAHLGLTGTYDPSETLPTGTPVPEVRTPSVDHADGGTYVPTSAISLSLTSG